MIHQSEQRGPGCQDALVQKCRVMILTISLEGHRKMELAASPKLGKNKQEKTDIVEQQIGIDDFLNNMIGKYISHQYTPCMLALIYQHHGSVMGLIGPSSGENDYHSGGSNGRSSNTYGRCWQCLSINHHQNHHICNAIRVYIKYMFI